MKYNSQIVLAYYQQCGLPLPLFEFRFESERKWKFDIAFAPNGARVAVEVQGGLFSGGRHVRGAALLKEHEKLNAAAILGWRVLYCQPKDVCMESFVQTIKAALEWQTHLRYPLPVALPAR